MYIVQKYKSLITSSLIALMVIVSPLVTFADNSKKDNRDDEAKLEINHELKSENNQKENSWFERSFGKNRKNKLTEKLQISEISVMTNKINKATISWRTSVKSNSLVWLSKESNIDTSAKPTIKKNGRVLSHKIDLKKLEANTKYYIIVGSSNGLEKTLSSVSSFTTNSLDENNSNPIIKNLEGNKVIKVGETAKITVNVSKKNSDIISFSADWGDKGNLEISKNQSTAPLKTNSSATFTHVYSNIGTYSATFSALNSVGVKDTKTIEIKVVSETKDETVPVISNIETKVNGSNVTLSWLTDEPTTSSIFYSATSTIDANNSNTSKVIDSKLVKKHSINLTSLASSTLYHFILKSVDAANNVVTSIEYAFRTN